MRVTREAHVLEKIPRPKRKKLTHVAVNREGSIYRLHVEDEADKKALFELTSDQALLLADTLDKLLADEEEEQDPRPRPSAPHESRSVGRDCLGTVKWYNVTKGFGFVTLTVAATSCSCTAPCSRGRE